MGTTGVARSMELLKFMAAKLKVNCFVLLRVALLLPQVTTKKKTKTKTEKNRNSVNFVNALSFTGEKESFRFKKLLELLWTLIYVFHRSMKKLHTVASFAKQVNKRLLKIE